MTDLFLQQNPLSPEPLDPNKKYFEELVGEGRKFKDPEELAKGKFQSDSYIKILETRIDQAREEFTKAQDELKTRAELSKLIDQLKANPPTPIPQPPEKVNEPMFDPTKLDSIFDQKFSSYEKQKREAANAELVQNKIKEKFGVNYAPSLEKVAQDIGLSKEDVNEMARTKPAALIKALGLDAPPPQVQNPIQSPFRSESFRPTGGQKRDWNYYQDLRKKDPQAWFDPTIAVQMQEDAIAQGASFYPE